MKEIVLRVQKYELKWEDITRLDLEIKKNECSQTEDEYKMTFQVGWLNDQVCTAYTYYNM